MGDVISIIKTCGLFLHAVGGLVVISLGIYYTILKISSLLENRRRSSFGKHIVKKSEEFERRLCIDFPLKVVRRTPRTDCILVEDQISGDLVGDYYVVFSLDLMRELEERGIYNNLYPRIYRLCTELRMMSPKIIRSGDKDAYKVFGCNSGFEWLGIMWEYR